MLRITLVVFCGFLVLTTGATSDAGNPAAPRRSSIMRPLLHSVHVHLRGLRGTYIFRDRPVAEQVGEGLSGKPEPIVKLADGNYLVAGCRFHSCEEKAAIISSPSWEMIGAAVISFPAIIGGQCQGILPTDMRDPRIAKCSRPFLSIFVRRVKNTAIIIEEFKKWALREGQSGNTEVRVLRS